MSIDTTRVIIVWCCEEPWACSLLVVCGTLDIFFYSSLWNLGHVRLLVCGNLDTFLYSSLWNLGHVLIF